MVDALHSVGYDGPARADLRPLRRDRFGVFMLIGATLGGLLGQVDLWIPYVARAVVLVPAFLLGLVWMMRTSGSRRGALTLAAASTRETRRIATEGVTYGFRDRVVRFMMFARSCRACSSCTASTRGRSTSSTCWAATWCGSTGVIAALVGLAGSSATCWSGR